MRSSNQHARGRHDGDAVAKVDPWTQAKLVRTDPEAERYVLGGVLLEPAVLPKVEALVVAEDFYVPGHALILLAMQRLRRAGKAIDTVSVCGELRLMDRLNTVGGPQYVSELTDTVPTVAHIETHAGTVSRHAVARRILDAAREVFASVGDATVDTDALCDVALARIGAATQRKHVGAPKSYGDVAQEYMHSVERALARGGGVTGATTGLAELDDLISGLHGAQVITVAARPAMGKSSLGVQMAEAVAVEELQLARHEQRRERAVLIASLEMARVEVFGRSACGTARGGVDSRALRRGEISQDQMNELVASCGRLAELPVFINDNAGATVAEIYAQCAALKGAQGLAAVMIDYVQLVNAAAGGRRGETREREVADMTRALKRLAKDFDVPVILLSQLSRKCEERSDKRPMLSDLRESGAIEQDSDVVIFVYRDEVYNPKSEDRGLAELIVAKQRNGPLGVVKVRWIGALTRFWNMQDPDAQAAAYDGGRPSGVHIPAPPGGYAGDARDDDDEFDYVDHRAGGGE